MDTPSREALRGKWRRWVFWAWIAASAAVAVYLAIGGPIASYYGEGRTAIALAVPALMFFMIATGLGWLVLFVTSRRRQSEGRNG